jgi:protein gp37
MNKQGKRRFDEVTQRFKVHGGIEWTKTVEIDGNERQGYTINPIGGCYHGCQWHMPDGKVAECYAKTVAERLAQKAYPYGFEHVYLRPNELKKPASVQTPSKFFLDSMSDVFGHWLPDEAILSVIKMAQDNPRHIFQCLTKNAKRILQFKQYLPPNLHIGVSSAPDVLYGKRLSFRQQVAYTETALEVLAQLPYRITWFSFEPLSWDMASVVAKYPGVLDWAVIGAASEGNKYYQPDKNHVSKLLSVLDGTNTPVFFKGNLGWSPWRESFPSTDFVDTANYLEFTPVPEHVTMPSQLAADSGFTLGVTA